MNTITLEGEPIGEFYRLTKDGSIIRMDGVLTDPQTVMELYTAQGVFIISDKGKMPDRYYVEIDLSALGSTDIIRLAECMTNKNNDFSFIFNTKTLQVEIKAQT